MEENILRGQVVLSNNFHGTYAIKVFEGDITVIEALGEPAMNIGDILSGNLESLGAQQLTNERTGDLIEAFVESVYCSIEEALCCLGFKEESLKNLREEDF